MSGVVFGRGILRYLLQIRIHSKDYKFLQNEKGDEDEKFKW